MEPFDNGEKTPLRYGENAYQAPSFLIDEKTDDPLAIPKFKKITGNPSAINEMDIDRGLHTLTHMAAVVQKNSLFKWSAMAVALKHGNPCGAALSDSEEAAIKKTIDGNRLSIFGGAFMCNFPITSDHATLLTGYGMASGRRPLDVIAAPNISGSAIDSLTRKNDRCFIAINPALATIANADCLDTGTRYRQVRGGWIEQPAYNFVLNLEDPEIKRFGNISNESVIDAEVAWAVCATSNSNTISIAKDGMLLANAVGQQDRVGAVELALSIAKKAGHDVHGATAVSDSFFPFPDAPQLLKEAGISRIIATSGSVNDELIQGLFTDSDTCELIQIPDKIGRIFFGH